MSERKRTQLARQLAGELEKSAGLVTSALAAGKALVDAAKPVVTGTIRGAERYLDATKRLSGTASNLPFIANTASDLPQVVRHPLVAGTLGYTGLKTVASVPSSFAEEAGKLQRELAPRNSRQLSSKITL